MGAATIVTCQCGTQPSITAYPQFVDQTDCQSSSNALPSIFSLVQRVEGMPPGTSLPPVGTATPRGIEGNTLHLRRRIARVCENAWRRAGGWWRKSQSVSAEDRATSRSKCRVVPTDCREPVPEARHPDGSKANRAPTFDLGHSNRATHTH